MGPLLIQFHCQDEIPERSDGKSFNSNEKMILDISSLKWKTRKIRKKYMPGGVTKSYFPCWNDTFKCVLDQYEQSGDHDID